MAATIEHKPQWTDPAAKRGRWQAISGSQAALAAAAVAYFAARLDPELQYHLRGRTFLLAAAGVDGAEWTPGGGLRLAGSWLIQGFHQGWLGVALAAALGVALVLGWRQLRAAVAARPGPARAWLPVAGAAALFACPGLPAVEAGLAGVAAAWLGVGMWRWRPDRPGWRQGAGWALAVLFYLLGREALLAAAWLWASLETHGRNRRWALAPLAAAALLLGGVEGLREDPWWKPGQSAWLAHPGWSLAWLASLPAAVLAWHGGGAGMSRAPGLLVAAGLAAAAAGVELARDQRGRLLHLVDCHARNARWAAAAALAPRLGPETNWTTEAVSAGLDLTRAMYHEGTLADRFFTAPRARGAPVLPGTQDGFGWSVAMGETLLELGQVNYAEHWAHEALETKGNRPEILQCLARVNLAKDLPEAARVFLGVLRRSPVYGGWARAWLRRLEEDPDWRAAPDLAPILARQPKTDRPAAYLPADQLLRQLLQASRTNRMAYEYLMVHHLQKADLEGFTRELGRMADFGYAATPRHFEEAILIAQSREGHDPALDRHPVRPETRQRYAAFQALLAQPAAPEERAARSRREFGGTYWHYYLFGS